MKKRNRLLAAFLGLALCLGLLSACGKKESTEQSFYEIARLHILAGNSDYMAEETYYLHYNDSVDTTIKTTYTRLCRGNDLMLCTTSGTSTVIGGAEEQVLLDDTYYRREEERQIKIPLSETGRALLVADILSQAPAFEAPELSDSAWKDVVTQDLDGILFLSFDITSKKDLRLVSELLGMENSNNHIDAARLKVYIDTQKFVFTSVCVEADFTQSYGDVSVTGVQKWEITYNYDDLPSITVPENAQSYTNVTEDEWFGDENESD